MGARWELRFRVVGGGSLLALVACSALVGVDDRYYAPNPGADATSPEIPVRGDEGTPGAEDGSAPRVGDAGLGDASAVRLQNDATVDVGADDAALGPALEADAPPTDASPSDGEDAAESAALPPPLAVGAANLQLWLRADRGVLCELPEAGAAAAAFGRITSWQDQSGRGNHARLDHAQLGPECQLAGAPHVAAGIDLPYFSAPGNIIVDETLDVDFSALANSDYTLFVVERRWADTQGSNGEAVIGTTLPLAVELSNPQSCSDLSPNQGLLFGYEYFNGGPQLTVDQNCNMSPMAWVAPVPPDGGPAQLTLDTASLDQRTGHSVWVNGVPITRDQNPGPLLYAAGGAVGRGLLQVGVSGIDERFRGDVAEVIAYDAALSDAARQTVEQGLLDRWAILPDAN